MHYKLYVRCHTYNQASYIVDALNGFTMQQTDFPYVCFIIDDASTDGEPEVIKQYISDHFDLEDDSVRRTEETDDYYSIITRHKTNRNCFFAVFFLKYNHFNKKSKYAYYKKEIEGVKYVALCEGDDYWTDPSKLQKQVDFLDNHPDYSLCCHRFKIYNEGTGKWREDYVTDLFSMNPGVIGLDVTNSENFKTRFTQTLTLCYRKSVFDSIVFPPYKMGRRDFNLHYHLLKEGKGYCFADFMGVYRRNRGGIWWRHTAIERAIIRLDAYKDLYKYNRDDSIVLERYCEWLELFYNDFVLPPFQRHKITRNGLKNLALTFQHDLGTEGVKAVLKHTWGCIKAFFCYC